MLGQIGFIELLIVFPLALVSLAIPLATLVIVLLIYGKLKRIEQLLDQSE